MLSTLNPQQREAVEQIYGPVLVLAGPGTGKTHLLTTRVAHLLNQDVGCEPQNILCLTFTENGATEMRNRLQSRIGPAAYQITIGTFHGFCQKLITENQDLFWGDGPAKDVIGDLDKALIFEKITKSKPWKHLSPTWEPLFYRGDFLSRVSTLKKEGFNPQTFRDLIPEEKERLEADPDNFYKKKYKDSQAGDWKKGRKEKIEKQVGKWEELAEFWELYDQELAKQNLYDFDDMVLETLKVLKTNEELLFDLQEKYQWLFVDEYQDTNNSQNELIWLLTQDIEDPNVFAVGDADQSIFRFQGANIANVNEFRTRFPSYKEIVLQTNYRSHQEILDEAYSSVILNSERASDNNSLEAFKGPGAHITKTIYDNPYEELYALSHQINDALTAGTKPSEIAILCRGNKDIAFMAEQLPAFGIPVSANVFANIFENEYVRTLIALIRVFEKSEDNNIFFDFLHTKALGIKAQTLLKLSRKVYKTKTNFVDMLLSELDPEGDLGLEKDEKLVFWFNFLTKSLIEYRHCRPAVLAEKMLYESGLAEELTVDQKWQDWQFVRRFIDWIREQKEDELKAILKRIELHESLGIPVAPYSMPQDKNSIKIMTAHKSKGLEFETVFITNIEHNAWGGKVKPDKLALPSLFDQTPKDEKKEQNREEERRLFFVALTRAKKNLNLSFAAQNSENKEKSPSVFWHEVSVEESFASEDQDLSMEKIFPTVFGSEAISLHSDEEAILTKAVENFVWSASSLNLFLKCPIQFLYQNLFKTPRKPMAVAAFGTAAHQALELFLQEKKSSPEDLLQLFEHALTGQNLEEDQYLKALRDGKEMLNNYFPTLILQQQNEFGNKLEYDFGKNMVTVSDIRITGKVDRVDFTNQSQTKVNIIDYKSGKKKPIKPGEDYWRQMVFYDLLVRGSKNLNWEVDSCAFEFLGSGDNTKAGRVDFTPQEEDRLIVIEELKTANQKLINLQFDRIPNPKGDPEIEYWQGLRG